MLLVILCLLVIALLSHLFPKQGHCGLQNQTQEKRKALAQALEFSLLLKDNYATKQRQNSH